MRNPYLHDHEAAPFVRPLLQQPHDAGARLQPLERLCLPLHRVHLEQPIQFQRQLAVAMKCVRHL